MTAVAESTLVEPFGRASSAQPDQGVRTFRFLRRGGSSPIFG